ALHERQPRARLGLGEADASLTGEIWKPARLVRRWLALRYSRVGLDLVGRLLLHACSVAQRGLVDSVRAPVRAGRLGSSADCDHDGRTCPRTDDHMFGFRGEMHEVPGP